MCLFHQWLRICSVLILASLISIIVYDHCCRSFISIMARRKQTQESFDVQKKVNETYWLVASLIGDNSVTRTSTAGAVTSKMPVDEVILITIISSLFFIYNISLRFLHIFLFIKVFERLTNASRTRLIVMSNARHVVVERVRLALSNARLAMSNVRLTLWNSNYMAW